MAKLLIAVKCGVERCEECGCLYRCDDWWFCGVFDEYLGGALSGADSPMRLNKCLSAERAAKGEK